QERRPSGRVGAGPRGRNADRRTGGGHRRRALFAAGGAHRADGAAVTARVGRGPAPGGAPLTVNSGPEGRPPDGPGPMVRETALVHVRELLHQHGATDDEIDQAIADDVLDLFVFDRILVPSRRTYTRREVAELTGVELDSLVRFWRALGFPNVDDEDRSFTDLDVEAVRLFQGMLA